MIRSLVFVLLSFFGFSAQAAVWTNVNSWSPAFEDRYAEWVRREWRVDFFSRRYLANGQSNPYYGLRVDCADAVYSMRVIFAYENRLPFVAQDPTSFGRTISNSMSRWDGQNETQRIRNFLQFIYETVSTRSLPNDTYPVAISRNTVRSGALILTTKKNHHSWTIKEILPIGVPHLVYNSVLGATTGSTMQERQSWPNPAWVFEDDFTPEGHAGFRAWRPTAYINRPVWEVPGYSEEQYRIPLNKWVRHAQSRLALRQETDDQMIARLLKTACVGFADRVTYVSEALDYLRKNPQCMNYATYDKYSSPSRDRRIFDDLMSLRRTYGEILQANGGNQLSAQTAQQLKKIFPMIQSSATVEASNITAQSITGASVCVTEYSPGRKMDLAEFKRRMFAGLISNNPLDDMPYRWGEQRGPSQRARSCPSWDPWSPDLSNN